MHIDLAIERLERHIRDLNPQDDPETRDAMKLGREALMRIRYLRQKPTITQKTPLETEDTNP